MVDRVALDDCVGCNACGDACPTGAISYPVDGEGFWRPAIDQELCVGCSRCEAACPALGMPDRGGMFPEPLVYAATNEDGAVRYDSTSGGVYNALGRATLDQGGWLVGCAFTEDLRGAEFISADDEAGLRRIMRSKYFQADASGAYRSAKRLLDGGEAVLFTGAPCQVAALRLFLGRDYENLITADFICLGINSPLAYRSYIDENEARMGSRVAEVRFKDKTRGWTKLGTKLVFENGRSVYRTRDNDPWVNAYVVGRMEMRRCCGKCRFKSFPRVADLSLGDFWGLEFTDDERRLGVSVVLVNSEKGAELLCRASGGLRLEEHGLDEALAGNGALTRPVEMGPGREEFFARIGGGEPYSKVVWSILGLPRWRRAARAARVRAGAVKSLARKGLGRLSHG